MGCEHHRPVRVTQNRLRWDRVAQTAASNWWLCPTSAGVCSRSQGKAASPLPSLEALVSGSSTQACPCPPDVWLWLAAPLCSSSLRSGRKWEENIQCTDAGQKTDVTGLLVTHVHPSLAEEAGGDMRRPSAPQEVGWPRWCRGSRGSKPEQGESCVWSR